VQRDAIGAKRHAHFGEHVTRVFPIGVQEHFADVDRSDCFGATSGTELGKLEVPERTHELQAMRVRRRCRDAWGLRH